MSCREADCSGRVGAPVKLRCLHDDRSSGRRYRRGDAATRADACIVPVLRPRLGPVAPLVRTNRRSTIGRGHAAGELPPRGEHLIIARRVGRLPGNRPVRRRLVQLPPREAAACASWSSAASGCAREWWISRKAGALAPSRTSCARAASERAEQAAPVQHRLATAGCTAIGILAMWIAATRSS